MFKNNYVNTAAIVGATSILSIIGTYLYRKKKGDQIPTKWKSVGEVTNLYLYPLKSGRAIELQEAQCTEYGLSHTSQDSGELQLRDRCLLVYKESDNEFRTARTLPKLVLIKITVQDESHIALDAPGMEQIFVELPLTGDGEKKSLTLFDERVKGIDCGDEVANWLSRYLLDTPTGLRLSYNMANARRNLIGDYPDFAKDYPNLDNTSGGLYSDLTSYMFMTKPSVDDLKNRVSEFEVNERYFRPTLLIDGEDLAPFDEDNWDWVKVGDVVFRYVKPCTRCVLTTVNPDNGVRHPKQEPLKTLKKYRISNKVDKSSPVMGIHMGLKMGGIVHVGDEVFIGSS